MAKSILQEKAVIITGASSGIGKALSLQLAHEGAWLARRARDATCRDLLALECRATWRESHCPTDRTYPMRASVRR